MLPLCKTRRRDSEYMSVFANTGGCIRNSGKWSPEGMIIEEGSGGTSRWEQTLSPYLYNVLIF